MTIIFLIIIFIFTITLGKGKTKKWIIILLILLFIALNKDIKDDGYRERLAPIEAETEKIDSYKKAVELILKNQQRVLEEDHLNKNNSGLYRSYPHPLADSIIKIQADSLKLRFIASPISTKIEDRDTTIVFEAAAGDYNMVSNNADELLEIPPYYVYRHSIIYSSKPLSTNKYLTKIDNNLYYQIHVLDEY